MASLVRHRATYIVFKRDSFFKSSVSLMHQHKLYEPHSEVICHWLKNLQKIKLVLHIRLNKCQTLKNVEKKAAGVLCFHKVIMSQTFYHTVYTISYFNTIQNYDESLSSIHCDHQDAEKYASPSLLEVCRDEEKGTSSSQWMDVVEVILNMSPWQACEH